MLFHYIITYSTFSSHMQPIQKSGERILLILPPGTKNPSYATAGNPW